MSVFMALYIGAAKVLVYDYNVKLFFWWGEGVLDPS
jgi:hypothetical protein